MSHFAKFELMIEYLFIHIIYNYIWYYNTSFYVTTRKVECIYKIHCLKLYSLLFIAFSPPTSEAAGSNLGPGTLCWKVGSYLPMSGGLECSMHWFTPPVNYPSQYDPGC